MSARGRELLEVIERDRQIDLAIDALLMPVTTLVSVGVYLLSGWVGIAAFCVTALVTGVWRLRDLKRRYSP